MIIMLIVHYVGCFYNKDLEFSLIRSDQILVESVLTFDVSEPVKFLAQIFPERHLAVIFVCIVN